MKILEGVIVSVGMSKTAVVEVSRRTPHPLYRKLIKRSKKYKADNTGFENLEIGNRVKIVETKPISKQKHFKILKLVSKKTELIKKDETAKDEEITETLKPVRKTKTISKKTKGEKTKLT